jgi:hypothetical protein
MKSMRHDEAAKTGGKAAAVSRMPCPVLIFEKRLCALSRSRRNQPRMNLHEI